MNAAQIVDRLEIAELFARYAWGMDRNDRAEFERVWTPDSVWRAPAVGIDCTGLVEIMAYFDRTSAMRVPTPGPGSAVRIVGSPILQFDGHRATSRSELLAARLADDGIRPYSLGAYHDELVRTPDGWRILSRLMDVNPLP